MSPDRFTEDELVERPALELLSELGWRTVNAYEETLGPGGTLGRDIRREQSWYIAYGIRCNSLTPRSRPAR